MKMLVASAAILASFALVSVPAMAANARHPHQNVNKRVDKGGSTGDAKTEQLNQQQLDMARSQNGVAPASSMSAPMGTRP